MNVYKDLVSGLPLETVEYAFAYGSGVLQQLNENKEEKMVDYIVCVKDSQQFHERNLKTNPHHYSFIR